ncbi:MAG: FAD-dependent monooxygenase [Burkholderiales bacterium]|nr:FAD-dependent monooxygenase [Burkholderiales bacterium]
MNAEPAPEHDVLIAGAGPVGMLLAIALAGSGLRWRLIGMQEAGAERPVALARGSELLLERLGLAARIQTTPIRTVHVSQRGAFGSARIEASDLGVPALGCVASYQSLCDALRREIDRLAPRARLGARVSQWSEDASGVSVQCAPDKAGGATPSVLRARLLVLAEGTPAAHRGAARDDGQSAVVAQVWTQAPHRNTAFERFTPRGPLALLPWAERLALIWCTAHEPAQALCALGEHEFLEKLGEAFGRRLGRFTAAGPRSRFALALHRGAAPAGERVIAVGNASQTLHPVAGQGLNLGLRDAWELAQLLRAARAREIGRPPFGRGFARRRCADRRGEIAFTDALVRAFSNDSAILGAARGAALAVFDLLPPARRLLARRAMFGFGI